MTDTAHVLAVDFGAARGRRKSLGDDALVWIMGGPVHPECDPLEVAFDKFLLAGLWRTCETLTPWGVEVGVSLGFGEHLAAVDAAMVRLEKRRWIARDHCWTSLAWRKPFSQGQRGHIYAVEYANGVTKVGRSKNIASRIQRHLSTGIALQVRPTRYWHTPEISEAPAAERALLAELRMGYKSTSSEYFAGGFSAALDFFGFDTEDATPCT